MMKKLATLTTAIAFVSVFAVNASAVTIDDSGVVGAFTSGAIPGPGNPPEQEDAAAEFLLDMLSNTEFAVGCSLSNTAGSCFQTSDNGDGVGYSGDLGAFTKVDNNDPNATGWTWVLGKYDGPNAGYILFYIPDWGNTLPTSAADIWGTGGQYGLSHTLRWGGSVQVPDGGATLMLLGAALGGLGLLRRRSKK